MSSKFSGRGGKTSSSDDSGGGGGSITLPAGDLSGTGSTNTTPRISRLSGLVGEVEVVADLAMTGAEGATPSLIWRNSGDMVIVQDTDDNDVVLQSWSQPAQRWTIGAAGVLARLLSAMTVRHVDGITFESATEGYGRIRRDNNTGAGRSFFIEAYDHINGYSNIAAYENDAIDPANFTQLTLGASNIPIVKLAGDLLIAQAIGTGLLLTSAQGVHVAQGGATVGAMDTTTGILRHCDPDGTPFLVWRTEDGGANLIVLTQGIAAGGDANYIKIGDSTNAPGVSLRAATLHEFYIGNNRRWEINNTAIRALDSSGYFEAVKFRNNSVLNTTKGYSDSIQGRATSTTTSLFALATITPLVGVAQVITVAITVQAIKSDGLVAWKQDLEATYHVSAAGVITAMGTDTTTTAKTFGTTTGTVLASGTSGGAVVINATPPSAGGTFRWNYNATVTFDTTDA